MEPENLRFSVLLLTVNMALQSLLTALSIYRFRKKVVFRYGECLAKSRIAHKFRNGLTVAKNTLFALRARQPLGISTQSNKLLGNLMQ